MVTTILILSMLDGALMCPTWHTSFETIAFIDDASLLREWYRVFFSHASLWNMHTSAL